MAAAFTLALAAALGLAAGFAATARGDIPTGSIEYETIFVVGFTLFLMTLILNAVSIRLVRRYRQVYE